MTPTNKDQALPDSVLPKFERDGCAGIPQVMWPWNSEWMRESDLSALLQALDPTVRARVLEPYQSEVMTRLEALAERVAVRHDDELSVARAEVAQKEDDYQGAMQLERETAESRDTWRRVADEKGAEVKRLMAIKARLSQVALEAIRLVHGAQLGDRYSHEPCRECSLGGAGALRDALTAALGVGYTGLVWGNDMNIDCEKWADSLVGQAEPDPKEPTT